MKRILCSLLAFGVCLTPITLSSIVQPIWAQTQDLQEQAHQLLLKGRQQRRQGNPQEAIETFKQALTIARQIKDRELEGDILHSIGFTYDSIGQPQQALKYYQQALPIRREVGDRRGEAATLNNIGGVYDSIGQPQQALKYYEQALPISREVGDRPGEATTLNNIGGVYHNIGQPQEALKYYEQALPILQEVGDLAGEATALNNIGGVYDNIGQPQQALKYYEQALPIRREVGDRPGEARTLNNIGFVYRDTNQPSKAIDNWKQSVTITLEMRGGLLREHRKQFLEAERGTAISLTDLLIEQNQPDKAFEWINLATTADLADYNRLIDAKVANPEAQKAIDDWTAKNQQLEFLRQQLQDEFSAEKARQMRELEAQVNQQAEDIANRFCPADKSKPVLFNSSWSSE